MSRRRPISLLVLAGILVCAAPAAAQQRTRVEIILPAPGLRFVEAPRVRTERLLTDSRVHDLLTSGFPARIHYTIERWAVKRWFDNLRASHDWTVVVRHDPLTQAFRVYQVRSDNALLLGEYASLVAADSALGGAMRTGITPPHRGERSYYHLRIDVEMLSVNDLNELERWLRGELRPAMSGERSPGTALERGARTLLIRALGGERRRHTARTEKFVP